ncbi:hypothetical protein HD554DRAFT_2055567 [Boletus coccyginus]|nr:hypothetical protein HD554DRAFT_2055567 [Boletus coccyginus]
MLPCMLLAHSLMHSVSSSLPMIRSVIRSFLVNPFMRVFRTTLWGMPTCNKRRGQANGPMTHSLIYLHTPASPGMEAHLRSS